MGKSETLDTLRAQMRVLEASECSDFYSNLDGASNSALLCEALEESNDETIKVDSSDSSSQDIPKRDAFSKIVGLINASEKSEHEIRKRLKQSGYAEPDIEDAISRATSCGLIDDTRYARILIRSRLNQGWGSSGIERELSRNGIDPSTIDGWPFDYPVSDDEQFDSAYALLTRKPPRSKNLRESAYRKLVQKGYSSSIASQVARQWSEDIARGN